MRSLKFVFAVLTVLAAIAATPAFAAPGEVVNLQWCPGPKTCLQWDPAPAATSYRVYRGERSSFPCLLTASVESCDDGSFATTTTSGTITDTPPAGTFFWYLVTASNGSGEGTVGTATPGPRQQNVTQACLPTCELSGGNCSVDGDCCSSNCIAGTCQAACCQPTAAFCLLNSDCCNNACSGGQCLGPCGGATDCPGVDSACRMRTCTAGACGFSDVPAGTPTGSQTPGDCHRSECDGLGNVVSVVDDNDFPVDGIQCTGDVCNAGTPSNPPLPLNSPCSQNGGNVCSASGTCVQCNASSQCPGTDNDCRQRTCSANTCGTSFATAGTPTSNQLAGDCQSQVCDGAGNITSVNDNADVPVDGNQCTGDVCLSGTPSNPLLPLNSPCSQNGGNVCSASGTCVQCNASSQCPGSDTECRQRTCSANACGFNFTTAGTPTAGQVGGDCHRNECDGVGNDTNVVDNADVPVDGNQCTGDVCNAGTPSNPPLPLNSPCSQNGGNVCSASATCVQCNASSQCPGSDTECRQRTCSANACGFSFTTAGTPTTGQVGGDCHRNECDGVGNIANVVDNADVPVDGNQCTGDVCLSGAPSNPPSTAGSACSQGGGTVCDGAGGCVSPPQVTATSPVDGASAAAGTSIAVTFSQAMNPATLTGQTSAGACAGSIQLSLDGFASCVPYSTAAAAMAAGNTVATFVPQPGLLVNRTYQIRVTTAAQNPSGIALGSAYTQALGFTTTSPNLCNGSLVIGQLYGSGGMTGATYRNDFIELHNRGTSTISLTGMSVQYASATGTTWLNQTNLSGSIPAGGYLLIQEFSSGAGGALLPTPELTGNIDMSGSNGKLALVANQTPLTGACPTGAAIIDFVGYGSTANCNEGGTNAPSPSATASIARLQAGCADLNVNGTDLAAGTPNPRNGAAAPNACACVARNESNAAAEADYCTTNFPSSLAVQTGVSTGSIFGQIFEATITEPAGPASTVRAQLGFGPPTANPQYQPGWTWVSTSYNTQVGNNDEYQGSFTAPAVGSYRYVYRFSVDAGVSWTYCDNNQGDAGSGSNVGLTFDFANEPVLTVTP